MFDPRVQFDSEEAKQGARVVWNTINVGWANQAIADGLPLKHGCSPFVRGNILLRKPDLNFDYTQEELDEFIRCKYDILHFAEKYCKLVDQTGRMNSITLRKYQKRLLRSMQTNKFVIILSGRQIGKTTTTAIYILWKLIFHKEERVALLGDKLATAGENLNKIKAIMNNLPFFLKPGIQGYNKGSMSFDNGSSIFVGPCTKSSLVGKSLTCLYIDELDIPMANQSQELVEYALPTIAAIEKGQAIFSSTPSVGGIFKKIFFDAVEKNNNFKAEQVNWWEVPGRDITWKQEMLKMYGKDAFNTQFNCRFLSSTNTIFNEDFIEQLERSSSSFVEYAKLHDDAANLHVLDISFDFINATGKSIIAETEPIENFYIRKNADIDWQNDFIICASDLAEGIGNDDTIFNFFRVKIEPKNVGEAKREEVQESFDLFDAMVDQDVADFDDIFEDFNVSLEQVAIFRSNKHSLKTAAYFLRAIATKLCNPNRLKLSIEYNKYGEAFINYLTAENSKLEPVELETLATTTHRERTKVGIHLSAATKKLYVPMAKSDLETGRIAVSDPATVNQLKYFGMSKNGSYAASPGAKDDIVMTLVNLSAYIDKTNDDYLSFVEEAIDSKASSNDDDDFAFGSW